MHGNGLHVPLRDHIKRIPQTVRTEKSPRATGAGAFESERPYSI